jgi:phytoene/squalene synthetase
MFLVALGSSAYAVRQQVVARRQTQAARIDLETLQSAARDYLALLRALERGLSPQQTAAVSEAEDHLRSLLQELEETPQEDLDARRRLLRRFNAEAKSVTLGVER